jgi:hypothetical protein
LKVKENSEVATRQQEEEVMKRKGQRFDSCSLMLFKIVRKALQNELNLKQKEEIWH